MGNNPIKFIDSDGKWIDFPPTNTTYWQQEALNQKMDETIKNNPSIIRANAMTEMARASDLNDAVVLGTAITHGSQAVNVDGTYATAVNKGFALGGTLLPFVSGSAVKGVLKNR